MSQMQESSLKDKIKQLSNEELIDCLLIMDKNNNEIPYNHLIRKISDQFFREVYLVEMLRVSTQCGIELYNRLSNRQVMEKQEDETKGISDSNSCTEQSLRNQEILTSLREEFTVALSDLSITEQRKVLKYIEATKSQTSKVYLSPVKCRVSKSIKLENKRRLMEEYNPYLKKQNEKES